MSYFRFYFSIIEKKWGKKISSFQPSGKIAEVKCFNVNVDFWWSLTFPNMGYNQEADQADEFFFADM
jgi:hypothetical protein